MKISLLSKSFGTMVIAALVAGGLSSPAAYAKEFKLTASSSHPPVVPWVKTIKDFVVPEAAKRAKALGHTIVWTEAYAGALYNFKNTLEGIGDGLGDIGWVGTLWEPNKLPLQNVTFYTPFVSDNVVAAAEIENEMHANIPAMKQAFIKNNQVYLGPQPLDDYVLITKTPLKTVADLKGMKLYAPGASAQWLKGTGAVAVNGGLPVYYNGIKTGVADGAIVPGTGIFPFKLHEVAPYITTVGLGGGFTGALTMNKNTYDKLPPELQKMFQEIGKGYGDLVAKRIGGFKKKSFEVLLPKAGAKVSTLPEAEQKKWAALLPDLAGDWVKQVESKGLPGKEVLKAYMDGVRKRGITPIRDWDK
ncbi:C4-dicarboxylate TRAP transporter substrate-binding protein [Pseudomonadota bacterium]